MKNTFFNLVKICFNYEKFLWKIFKAYAPCFDALRLFFVFRQC